MAPKPEWAGDGPLAEESVCNSVTQHPTDNSTSVEQKLAVDQFLANTSATDMFLA